VRCLYPKARVLGISAKDDVGMEEWLELVQTTPPGDHWLEDIDYEKYAEADAEMGWLNAQVTLTFPEPADGKMVGFWMTERLAQGVSERNGRIGHLKLLAVGPTGSIKAGVTQIGEKPVLEGTVTGPTSSLHVTVNMRATLSPGDLAAILVHTAEQFGSEAETEVDISAMNTFRPGAPKPTHRYGE